MHSPANKHGKYTKLWQHFIHTKFHQNPLSGPGEKVENENCLTDYGRRTDDG